MMNNTLIDITKLSDEEKAQYYNDWKESGLKAVQFCTEKRLPFISFRYWCKRYKKKEIRDGSNAVDTLSHFYSYSSKEQSSIKIWCSSGKSGLTSQKNTNNLKYC